MRSFLLTPLAVLLVVLAGCAGSQPAESPLDARVLGEWESNGGTRYTFTDAGDTYGLSVIDDDGEVFEVVSVTWADGALGWSYDVPSTGYTVRESVVDVSESRIEVEWENQTGASGTDTLTRTE